MVDRLYPTSHDGLERGYGLYGDRDSTFGRGLAAYKVESYSSAQESQEILVRSIANHIDA